MLKILGLSNQEGKLPSAEDLPNIKYIGSAPEVQDAISSVYGVEQHKNPRIMAMARAINNVVMGPGTAVRNIMNMPAFIAQYVQVSQLPKAITALAKVNESRVKAFKNNATRNSYLDYDAAGMYLGNPNPVIRLLNKFSALARKYQGRDFSDRFEGEYYYSLGELLAQDNINKARAGNKESLHFINRFGDLVEGGAERLLKKGEKITEEDISRIAKRFVDAARGTYSEEGLPSFAIEGWMEPFTALSRFSIEKSNTIWKDVVQPMRKGIYGPLLRYTLASLGVGLSIEQLNELFTGKRSEEAKLGEIAAAGSAKDAVPKLISLLQLGSYAGIIADGAKLAARSAQGKSARYSQPLSFPLYSFAADTIIGNISDAVKALNEGEDPVNTMAKLIGAIASQSSQAFRYVNNNLLSTEETARKNKFRDIAVFNELQGEPPIDATVTRPNPYADADIKKFKKTGDLQEAAQMLPELIQKAVDKSNGDYEKLQKEFNKIKANNYQTMPSPDSMPRSFISYLEFLRKTQGDDAANERLTDYMTQRAINSAKAQMVPNI